MNVYICCVENFVKLAYRGEVDKLNCGSAPYEGCFYEGICTIVYPAQLGSADTGNPDQIVTAEQQRNVPPFRKRDFPVDKQILNLFSAAHTERYNSIAWTEGANQPGKRGSGEV